MEGPALLVGEGAKAAAQGGAPAGGGRLQVAAAAGEGAGRHRKARRWSSFLLAALFELIGTGLPTCTCWAAEGVWNDGLFMELPPPGPEEVEAVLERTLAQLLPDFESRGLAWPEDEYQALQARSAQLRLPLDDQAAPARRGRLAVMMGFSLARGHLGARE